MNTTLFIEQVTERIYTLDPSLQDRYGEKGKDKCRADNKHHLDHLQTAFELDNAKVFTDYTLWLNGILQKYGMKTQTLLGNFVIIKEELEHFSDMPDIKKKMYLSFLTDAIDILECEKAKEEA
ncbi:hypothetical protein F7984_12225 [Pradoshia sp. D12]|uniref:hypothetical protein n=1 Tax=Bacillaceae TaxID=186817 RepID=UPI00080ACAE6|nr:MULTISPECIES: hypothetical protein [Bacillaceae]OCA86146.1 hypothetical protein A8L44_06945 [Bacillus sp. FJAT-27986]QFK71938.1 hypothetical protein F7984_12225 [Pradoshia sp. D12]TPF71570.1 hypothetical protein FHY44_13975 [Bacillus sp. D12]